MCPCIIGGRKWWKKHETCLSSKISFDYRTLHLFVIMATPDLCGYVSVNIHAAKLSKEMARRLLRHLVKRYPYMYMLYTLYEHLNNTCYNVYIYKSMCTHICVCARAHACRQACMHAHTHTHTHTCMHTKSSLYWHTGNIVCHTCLCHWICQYLNNVYHYDYYDASIQLKENKYMPRKCYLFNQSINAVKINAHYIQLIINNKIC
jgi:hypothetical protein